MAPRRPPARLAQGRGLRAASRRRCPSPAAGQILVRNLYLSVDPYMRGRMNDVKSYVPPFELDQPMEGGAVGEVIASNAEGFAVGDHVLHGLGWREYADVRRQARRQGRRRRSPRSPPTSACSA